jgi:adenylosuccinate synthase
VTRYAVRVNGFDSLALMKLDVLDDLAEIKICTAYKYGNEVFEELPSDCHIMESCEPVYEIMPGWNASTSGVREFKDLPAAARRYIDRLSDLIGGEIGMISTGPDRLETVIRPQSAIASWFV